MIKKKRFVMTIVFTVLLTLAAVLVVANFSTGEKNMERQLPRLYPASSPQFLRAMGSLLGPAIVGGNRVQELLNGDQIFPSMLSAIRGAQNSITFETYIYWSGDIGREFGDALTERARAAGFGRLNQLRQPVFPAERRGQPQCVRRHLCRASSPGF